MSAVDDLADDYVEQSAALDPVGATASGVTGYDHALTDWSPAGNAARADLVSATLTALERTPIEDDRDRIAAEVLRERLLVAREFHDTEEDLRALRPIDSPVEAARMVFDLMPTETEEDWDTIRARLDAMFISGHGEGWALYAERLMDELGYFEQPHFYLGYLRAQAFRAMRVVVDIGVHTGLVPPPGAGERWTYDTALAYALTHGWEQESFLRSEVDRYLGWPGQAISYKVGERAWLELRADAERADPSFDLAVWHRRALGLGPMGLAQLRRELAAGTR